MLKYSPQLRKHRDLFAACLLNKYKANKLADAILERVDEQENMEWNLCQFVLGRLYKMHCPSTDADIPTLVREIKEYRDDV